MPRCEKKTYQKIIQLMADFDTLINFKVRFYISMAIELLIWALSCSWHVYMFSRPTIVMFSL